MVYVVSLFVGWVDSWSQYKENTNSMTGKLWLTIRQTKLLFLFKKKAIMLSGELIWTLWWCQPFIITYRCCPELLKSRVGTWNWACCLQVVDPWSERGANPERPETSTAGPRWPGWSSGFQEWWLSTSHFCRRFGCTAWAKTDSVSPKVVYGFMTTAKV